MAAAGAHLRLVLLFLGWKTTFFKHALASLVQRLLVSTHQQTTMSSPVDSMSPSDGLLSTAKRMVHVKTKEECRLGNETIEVWCIELPSKHAEGILKSVPPPPTCSQWPV